MKCRRLSLNYRYLGLVFLSLLMAASCGRSRNETISGVTIPVPSAMKKSAARPTEISFLGFGAGQATYHGSMKAERVIEFYQSEMPSQGWQPSMNLRGGGAMLAYSKDGKSVMIGINQHNDETVLSLTVSGVGK